MAESRLINTGKSGGSYIMQAGWTPNSTSILAHCSHHRPPAGCILKHQAVIDRLQRRIEELEGKAKPGGPPRMPGPKPGSAQRLPERKVARMARPHGFARQSMTSTHSVEHVVESCPKCGAGLAGGWVQRTRGFRFLVGVGPDTIALLGSVCF